MNKDELKKQLDIAAKNYADAKIEIYKEYAFSNNPYKVGDIISDYTGSIKIEKIGVLTFSTYSECRYTGVQVNKDGSISKRQKHTVIYQSNIQK